MNLNDQPVWFTLKRLRTSRLKGSVFYTVLNILLASGFSYGRLIKHLKYRLLISYHLIIITSGPGRPQTRKRPEEKEG